MLILNEHNKVVDTDKIAHEFFYWVLKFKDTKNPDFFVDKTNTLEEFPAASVVLEIGSYRTVVPLHWSVLCSDGEYVQSIPLYEISGRTYSAFCLNPIDGYIPNYPKIKIVDIYNNMIWNSPPLEERDFLLIPLGEIEQKPDAVKRGPLCAIFGPSKMEITRPIADIW